MNDNEVKKYKKYIIQNLYKNSIYILPPLLFHTNFLITKRK